MSSIDIIKQFNETKCELFDEYYAGLNDSQKEAIYCVNGPLLVLAGAGSGKTTVLTKRIAQIINFGDLYHTEIDKNITEEDLNILKNAKGKSKDIIRDTLKKYAVDPCPPWSILSITFTNKAANEMKKRLLGELGVPEDDASSLDLWSGTFHSMCVRVLRKFAEEIGIQSNFTIFDSDDSKKTITKIMKEYNVQERTLQPKLVHTYINRAKEQLITPDDYLEKFGNGYVAKCVAQIYREYNRRLRESNILDFDDIIQLTVELLQKNGKAYDYLNNKFKYICVDEFQDTNGAQLELVKLLSDKRKNLMVVGDDDQSIYKFRGACIDNILHFDEYMQNCKIVKLEQNYRSTGNILGAANSIIANNKGRHRKSLYTDKSNGEKIIVKQLSNSNDEAKYIINIINELKEKENKKYSDFAILYRMNAQSAFLEHLFSKSRIPFKILGGLRFYERKEIKDIMSYLCLIFNLNDNLRLKRVINEPKRKIGETTVLAVEQIARDNNCSMFEIMQNADKFPSLSRYAPKLQEFVNLILMLKELSTQVSIEVLMEKILELTGYSIMLLSIESPEEYENRIANIRELINIAASYAAEEENPTLQGFLESTSLVADVDNYDGDEDKVIMMTIHSAKGLEFPVVFIPGFEESIFPAIQSSLNIDDLEEERRLAYVACTRAKERLYCTHAEERKIYGKTQTNHVSRFVKEIDDEFIEDTCLAMMNESDRLESDERNALRTRKEHIKHRNISSELLKDADALVSIKKSHAPTETFQTGDKVTHQAFGDGEITNVVALGIDVLYEIEFDDFGKKRLVGSKANLKKI